MCRLKPVRSLHVSSQITSLPCTRYTEKFDQAIGDYSSGLHLKQKLLPVHSRQVAEAHYRLALAMDLTPGKLAGAIGHAEKALQSVDVRLSILKGKLEEAPAEQDAAMEDGSASADAKGKAKATGMIGSLANDNIDGLSKSQIEAQIKEFEELRGDLAAKVSLQPSRSFWYLILTTTNLALF